MKIFEAVARFLRFRTLKESRERYELAVMGSNDGIWDWNVKKKDYYFSPHWKNMLGYSDEEIENKFDSWVDLLHPEDRERALKTVNDYLEGKTRVYELSHRLRHKDGTYRWILARGAALHDSSGKPYRIAGSHTDVTIRRQAEEQLRQAHILIMEKEAQMRSIIRHMPVALFLKDVRNDFRFVLWNDNAEIMFGLRKEQVLGKNDYDFFPKDQADFFRKKDEEVMAGKEAMDIPEEPIDSKNLGRILLHTIKVPLMDAQGKPQYLLGISENITERKKVEQMKNEFISTVSHELRTPLTSIRGSLGLILGGVTGEISGQAKSLLDIAHRNSERLVRLINDILDVEKIAAGKMHFKSDMVEVHSLIEQSLESNRAYAEGLGVHFVISETVPGSKIKGDSDRLMQVMANLLSNACKYSPSGGAVEVGVKRMGPFLRVFIRDHGPGIPPEFQDRIFQKFSQADSSDGRQKGGTGLGLSITKAIVEKMGGQINFYAMEDEGTTFYFELPEAA